LDIFLSLLFNFGELNGHPPQFNIQLQSAHWTPSTVQYSTPMSSMDTLRSLILGCNKQIPINPLVTDEELIRHVPQCNIELINTITICPDMLGQFNTQLVMS